MNQFGNVIDISNEFIWESNIFHKILINGLEKEGFSKPLTAEFVEWLNSEKPKNFEELKKNKLSIQARLSKEVSEEFNKLLEYLDEIRSSNENCYLDDTPEKSRVIRWPNNLAIKEDTPDRYFDIYKDYFYKKHHRFITKNTAIGSAGSCFALRIAHQLQLWGYNYVIEEDDLPNGFAIENLTTTNYRMAPARWGTLFNTPSMRQVIERGFGYWEPEKFLVKSGSKLVDPFRSIRPNYKDELGFELDYANHTAAIKRALLKCEVFVITLGLAEAWYFAHSGAYTSAGPWKVEPSLVRQKTLSVAENVSELERIYEIYKKHNPNIKLIISVSPVPFNKSFSKDNHVVVANSLSKSILRVAAEEFTKNHPKDTFYFPSYEIVISGTKNPFETDMRHVSFEAVGRVMKLFQKMFLIDQNELPIAAVKENKNRFQIKRKIKKIGKYFLRGIP